MDVLAKLYLQSGKFHGSCRRVPKGAGQRPKDQTAVYHLIQALRKTGKNAEIPDLLKRLAVLRKQAAQEESERNQYKMVEGDTQPK